MTKTIEISENPRKNQQNGKWSFGQFSSKVMTETIEKDDNPRKNARFYEFDH